MKLALAGDTMLGRSVGEALASRGPKALVASDVVAVAREADLFLLNLECCISERVEPWPDPAKAFFFRAPPAAVDLLCYLGVDCVTLANNHALDFGEAALLDTFTYLAEAGIAWVGAGTSVGEARAPVVLEGDVRLAVVGVTDHPRAYAAGRDRPGVAFADLAATAVPAWLRQAVAAAPGDAVLVTPHWGPNMVGAPVPHVRAAADELLEAGATLVAGHSAHAFHGVGDRLLYDLGDFLDDYAVQPDLRNDLGLLFLVELDGAQPVRLEAVPLRLDYCHTRLAPREDATWISERFRRACAALGTKATEEHGRFVVDWGRSSR